MKIDSKWEEERRSLSKEQIKKHYGKGEPLLKQWGENDGFVRIGSNGPGEGWYEYPNGYENGNIRRPRVLTRKGDLSKDYDKLVGNAVRERKDGDGGKYRPRSIYSTLNFSDLEGGFVQKKSSNQVWSKSDGENVVQGNPLPDYPGIEYMNLFGDIDLKKKYKTKRQDEKIKETTRKAIEVYVREFRKLAPNSVNVLDSGGGFYPLIHHNVTKPISENFSEEKSGRIFDELTSRFNERLQDIWETVKEEVPEAEVYLDPDTINNKNRLMKTPLSIHRKLDVVVHPIDPDNPDFEPEAPNDESIIQETKEWLDNRNADKSDIETLISELWPDFEGSWGERLESWLKEERRKREKRKKERLERKRELEERIGELGKKGETIKGFPVTNTFDDVLATVETIDMRDMVKPHITKKRDGQAPRFDPPWRTSETGTSCFATEDGFTDLNENKGGGGPVKFVARKHELISSCDEKLEGEAWWEAIQILREEYGYKIPVLIPDINTEMPNEDGETYDQTPHWGILKAGFCFGIIDESYLKEEESEDEEEDEEEDEKPDKYFPIRAFPSEYNQILRELEDRGFEHGRDKEYWAMDPAGNTKFVPKLLGEDILHDYHFATIEESQELYVYQDGIYRPKGEIVVGEEAQRRLDQDAKNTRIREALGWVKRQTYTPTEEFGASKREISVENGILNLETRELEEPSPDKIILTKLPVEYVPEADCPKIKEFVRDLVADEGDVKKIQEMLGYTLLKENPLNRAFMGLGPGANGRSTLFNLFQRFIGKENTAGVDLIELVRNRFAKADLFGKIANFCADIGDKKIRDNSNRFKKLVGEDRIRAEHKNQDAFYFKCYATPWFSANDLPETADKTRSFYRRWVIIQFPFTFTSDETELDKEGFKKKNPDYPDPLMTDEEFSGLLNWALDGLDRVLENEMFTNERKLDQKRELWELESDPIADFLDKWCLKGKGFMAPKETVRKAYSEFCDRNDNERVADQVLTKRLKKHGITTKRSRTEEYGRVRFYKGFILDHKKAVEDGPLSQVSLPFPKLLDSKAREYLESYGGEWLNDVDKPRDTQDRNGFFSSREEVIQEILRFYKEYGDSEWTVDRFLDTLEEQFDKLDRETLRSYVEELKTEGDITLAPEEGATGGVEPLGGRKNE